MSSINNSKRLSMLIKNYLLTRKEGQEIKYDIRPVIENDEPNYEHYIIKLVCFDGIYKGQTHYIELKTKYGTSNERYEYPICPPSMKFLTKIFHVNINEGGLICLDILNDRTKWSVAYKFSQIILSIKLLLEDPNINSPFNCDACNLWKQCMNKSVESKDNNNDKNKIYKLFINHSNEVYKSNIETNNYYEKLFIKNDEDEFNEMFNNLCINKNNKLSQTNENEKINWTKIKELASKETMFARNLDNLDITNQTNNLDNPTQTTQTNQTNQTNQNEKINTLNNKFNKFNKFNKS